MKRVPVESTRMNSVGYDPESMTMEIEFNNGKLYQYHPINQTGYDAFWKSHSKGGFFNQHIRDNKDIICTKIEGTSAHKGKK